MEKILPSDSILTHSLVVPGQIPGGRRKGDDIMIKLHEGEYFEDWQKHLGHEG